MKMPISEEKKKGRLRKAQEVGRPYGEGTRFPAQENIIFRSRLM